MKAPITVVILIAIMILGKLAFADGDSGAPPAGVPVDSVKALPSPSSTLDAKPESMMPGKTNPPAPKVPTVEELTKRKRPLPHSKLQEAAEHARAGTTPPAQAAAPIQLESVQAAKGAAPHQAAPVPLQPTFTDGCRFTLLAIQRNPDLRDPNAIMNIAAQLWNLNAQAPPAK